MLAVEWNATRCAVIARVERRGERPARLMTVEARRDSGLRLLVGRLLLAWQADRVHGTARVALDLYSAPATEVRSVLEELAAAGVRPAVLYQATPSAVGVPLGNRAGVAALRALGAPVEAHAELLYRMGKLAEYAQR
ncbi:hypothetical protein EDD38_7640 [Kitasatospora cineracea]|uniref:Uncharacterized protein n=1 Tax=Kitasatospora cineracea TaxID=88074 RepID=A0A3N4R5B4_9ACTN|nr:hypothetical protein EDD38_7640 [Kitasatospora cineracea]